MSDIEDLSGTHHLNTRRMRWTVRGIPRVPWNAEGVFDGVSTFRLDRKGLIYEHQASTSLVYLTSAPSPVLCWIFLYHLLCLACFAQSALHGQYVLCQRLVGR